MSQPAKFAVVLALVAVVSCSGTPGGPGDLAAATFPQDKQADVRMTLTKTAVTNQSRSFRFQAEIEGGADNNPALYCQPTTWDLGDGPALSVTPMCAPWTADVKIPRRFENMHAYEKPGSYTVALTYGPLTARVAVDVP